MIASYFASDPESESESESEPTRNPESESEIATTVHDSASLPVGTTFYVV